jgi:hypothetical protein
VYRSEVDVENQRQMNDITERIKRVGIVLEQLSTLTSKSLTPIDTFRVALMLVDTINEILFISPVDSPHGDQLVQIKTILINRKEFTRELELTEDQRDVGGWRCEKGTSGSKRTIKLADKMDRFDAISWWNCGRRATRSLESIIELFYQRRLDPKLFPTLKRSSTANGLVKNVSRNKIIVLVLGSVSHDELTRMKHTESVLLKRRTQSKFRGKSPVPECISGDVVVMSGDVIRPDEFVRSL